MNSDFEKYASVLLEISTEKTFDYGIPNALVPKAVKGVRVAVPMRGRLVDGYIVALKDAPEITPVKPIAEIGTAAKIQPDLFELALWMGKYYGAPLQKILKVMLPSSVRQETGHKEQLFVVRNKTREEIGALAARLRGKKEEQTAILDVMLKVTKGILLTELLEEAGVSKSPVDTLVKQGILTLDVVRIDRSPLVGEEYLRTKPKPLSDDQQKALDTILREAKPHLIHGVTGSGKTEVYLRAIDHFLQQGKGSIVLVPEISLTTQMIERFRSRFEEKVAILHHRLSHGERYDEWQKIANGEAKIVLGPRSAVFCPIQNLGLIIVDEEHELSYKQSEESPYYNARDVAIVRGKLAHCSVVLGSATPSLESYHNALKGKYTLSTLSTRPGGAVLPDVKIVDMAHEYEKAKGYTLFSDPLLSALKKRVELGEQTILFLNRRGYHTAIGCTSCRESIKCIHCDLALTYHKKIDTLACHLCGYSLSPPPSACPTCQGSTMKFRGVGTEQVERALKAVFPHVRSVRIDGDTTRHKGSHQKLLREFGSGKADVLIGTQMISKGLHFPAVTLVGVLNCDGTLNMPDFRASETAFQLITQVAGRAGRGSVRGEVFIQTTIPKNTTIGHACRQDYLSFYKEEIASRELFQFPPFKRLAKLSLSSPDEGAAHHWIQEIHSRLTSLLDPTFELLPCTPSGYAKVKDKFRTQFIVKIEKIAPFHRALEEVKKGLKLPKTAKFSVDIDPASTF